MPGACAPSTSTSIPRDCELADEPLDRQDEPRRARHVVDERQPRPRARPATRIASSDLAPASRRGNGSVGHDDARARAGRHGLERVPAGVVGVVRGEELVARLEIQRPEHRVDAGRGVRDEDEVVRVGPHERRRARLAPRRAAPRGPAPRNRTGSASRRSRRRPCASSTARGQAPNEPWFRKVTSGSSDQSRRQPSEEGPGTVTTRHPRPPDAPRQRPPRAPPSGSEPPVTARRSPEGAGRTGRGTSARTRGRALAAGLAAGLSLRLTGA